MSPETVLMLGGAAAFVALLNFVGVYCCSGGQLPLLIATICGAIYFLGIADLLLATYCVVSQCSWLAWVPIAIVATPLSLLYYGATLQRKNMRPRFIDVAVCCLALISVLTIFFLPSLVVCLLALLLVTGFIAETLAFLVII